MQRQTIFKQCGFTLLEVLIAIMITALIGIGANEVLSQAIETSERTQQKLDALGALQKAVLVMTRDFRQVTYRSVRDEFGDQQPAVSTRNDEYKLIFTRTGWRNPLGDMRSNQQRVAYQLEDGVLKRMHWQTLDLAQDSKPFERELLRDIEELQFRFMNDSGGWVDEWPPDDTPGTGTAVQDPMFMYNRLPKAIAIRMNLKEFGEITKTYDLGAYLPNTAMPNANNNGNNNGNNTNDDTNQDGIIDKNPEQVVE